MQGAMPTLRFRCQGTNQVGDSGASGERCGTCLDSAHVADPRRATCAWHVDQEFVHATYLC